MKTKTTLLLGLLLLAAFALACSNDDDDSGIDDPDGNANDDDSANDDDDDGVIEYEWTDPTDFGPYPVGVTTRVFIDESRIDPFMPAEGEPRTLMTDIWYPAGEGVADYELNTVLYYLEGHEDLVDMLINLLGGDEPANLDIEMNAYRDAPLADVDGTPFPLVVFSHGNTGLRMQSFSLCEYLASHGYIVVSSDHTGNAAVTILPDDRIVIYNPVSIGAVDARVYDVLFLADTMVELNENDPEGFFTGAINPNAMGIGGHSFGGVTTVTTMMRNDSPFIAGVPQAGVIPYVGPLPVMYQIGDQDRTVSNDAIIETLPDSEGPAYMAELIDAGHFTFSNMCDISPAFGDGCGDKMSGDQVEFTYMPSPIAFPIIHQYETAFFGRYLKGIDEYDTFLGANQFSEDILNYQTVLPTAAQ